MGDPRFPERWRFAGLVIFIFLAYRMPLYSDNIVHPDLSAKVVNTGGVLTWEMFLPDADDPQTVTVETLPQLDGGVLISGPIIRRNYIQKNRRSEQEGVRVVCLFRAGKTGIRPVSSAVVSVGDITYRTGVRSVEVHSFYRNQSVLPPKIEWQIEKTRAYENENVIVYLILKERRSLAMPERISIQSLRKGALEEVKGLCPVRRYSVGDTLVFDLPLAAYFYTAGNTGRAALPQVTVSFEDLGVAVTPPAYIDIIPLPDAVKRTNAVGDFSFTVVYEKKPLTEGSRFNVALVLEGSGNFNRLVFPEIKAGNLIEVGRKPEDVWYRDGNRYSGVKRLNYQFVVEKGGDPVSVEVPELYWFSVVNNRVQKSSPVNIRLKTDTVPKTTLSSPVGSEYPVYSPDMIISYKEYNPFSDPLYLLIFLPGCILFLLLPLVFLVKRKIRKKTAAVGAVLAVFFLLTSQSPVPDAAVFNSAEVSPAEPLHFPGKPELLKEAQKAFEEGRYEAAVTRWTEWEQETGNSRNARLCFNKAVASAAAEKHADAVSFARKAVSLNPMNSLYCNFYEKLEREYGLRYSIGPVIAISGFAAFLFLGIGFNLFALFVFLSVVLKQRLMIVFAVVCIVEIGLSCFILSLYVFGRLEENVILTENGALLKIPHSDASSVLNLPEGSVLNVLGETEDFYLVKNSLGITGWIEKRKLREENSVIVPGK